MYTVQKLYCQSINCVLIEETAFFNAIDACQLFGSIFYLLFRRTKWDQKGIK